jgi:hypothetical protein
MFRINAIQPTGWLGFYLAIKIGPSSSCPNYANSHRSSLKKAVQLRPTKPANLPRQKTAVLSPILDLVDQSKLGVT